MFQWQLGAAKSGVRLSEKKGPDFLNFLGPVIPAWVVQLSQTLHMGMVSTECLWFSAKFASSIKVFEWLLGATKSGSMIIRKKGLDFLNFIGPVTPSWVV